MRLVVLSCLRRRVNPVEHVYAAFPMLLYLNSSIAGALLQPLLESQAGQTSQQFAAADIGNAYPNATGTEGIPNQGVERESPIVPKHALSRVL